MEKLSTMITKDYVPDWSVADGIREFITNALDSPAKLLFNVSEGMLILTSEGITLQSSSLLLGKSDNRADKDAVGKHGEDMVIGCVPVLREGGSVKFYNGGEVWEPCFELHKGFNEELLHITIRKSANKAYHQGFTVEIKADDADIQKAIDRCLYLRGMPEDVYQCDMGTMFKEPDGESKLYVGGVWVKDCPELEYSYDFKPKYLHLNRDRKTVDDWDLKVNTAKMASMALPKEDLVTSIVEESNDVHLMQYGYGLVSDVVADEVYTMLKDKYGEDTVFVSDYEVYSNWKAKGVPVVEVSDTINKVLSLSSEHKSLLDKYENTGKIKIPEDSVKSY